MRAHFQVLEVDIGLVEAVEQHERVGSGQVEPSRHVSEVAEVGAELYRQRDVHLAA